MAPLFPLILRRRNSGNTSNKSKKMSSPPNGCFLPALTHILAQRIEPAADGFFTAFIDGVQNGLLPQDPEEHDARQQSAQGADVDGDQVHPLGGPGLDHDGNGKADDADGSDRRGPLEV